MIKAENLSYSFPHKELYNKISFTLEDDVHCAFIGTNGTGKSTLVNMILYPDKYLYDGKLIVDVPGRIGYVSQFYTVEEEKEITVFDYISEEFKQTGVEVTEQTFEVNGKKYRNIIAHFGPKEGAVTVIGAHYDSYADTPGADDNASGVAGLIELAHLLQKNPPKNSVELIAYTLEEPPFFKTENMGSVHHAHAFKTSGRPLRLMISIEMIGYFSDKSDSQNYPIGLLKTLYPNKGNFIGIIGRSAESKEARKIKALMSGATDLPVYSMNAPVSLVTGLDFSDHRNFWAEGFNALLITDTAFFRNKNYHELEDTADTLDYSRMAKVIQGIYAVIQNY